MPRWPKKQARQPKTESVAATPENKATASPYVFGLKPTDLFAPDVIEYWADRVSSIRGNCHPKVKNARRLAEQLREARENGAPCKVPD